MSDYPMLISNKLHSFRNFIIQIYKKISPLQTDWSAQRAEYRTVRYYLISTPVRALITTYEIIPSMIPSEMLYARGMSSIVTKAGIASE